VDEEGRGENEVVQPVNLAANVAANAPTNPAANAWQLLQPTPLATSSTMQLTL
jgi:hypothetical protein